MYIETIEMSEAILFFVIYVWNIPIYDWSDYKEHQSNHIAITPIEK